ncbi:uncharacterized protein EDB91DRAFT_1076295 [Suillus paluster]|uniref:uncharacterized protein n=1 Tax=Suillus paluster TaxID=48578 RepID=UPI001B878A00|nr:uncharacterized protein EDB91DRAFT_1076295 [Suillus paluster]KAG1756196.1 hypothetical protein EDB91DRAFT_1076295 [Suillus paluster]
MSLICYYHQLTDLEHVMAHARTPNLTAIMTWFTDGSCLCGKISPSLVQHLSLWWHGPRIQVIMGLRAQDPIPDWVSHIALVLLIMVMGETILTGGLDHGKPVVDIKHLHKTHDETTEMSSVIPCGIIGDNINRDHTEFDPRSYTRVLLGHLLLVFAKAPLFLGINENFLYQPEDGISNASSL